MDNDTVMADGNRSEYPDPTAENRTPYPSLSQDWASSVATSKVPSGPKNGGQSRQPMATDMSTIDFGGTSQPTIPWDPTFTMFHAPPEPRADLPADQALVASDRMAVDGVESDRRNTTDAINTLPGTTRGRGRGRGRPRGRGRGAGGGRGTASSVREQEAAIVRARGRPRGRPRGWKALLQGTEHAELFTKPKVSRLPSGKKRGRPVGRPPTSVNATGDNWIDPGDEYRELQRKATAAYLDGDLDAALDYAKLAVEKNSEVFLAHKMIHDIYERQGKDYEAVYALAVGVNTMRNSDLWAELGERIVALEEGDLDWARDCFAEAIKLKKDCYRARVGKFRLHEEMEDWEHARLEAKTIVRKWPRDLEHVNKYAELCVKSGNAYEWERAQAAYERTFEAYADDDMLGDDYEQQWVHLNDYLEVLLRRGLHLQGIQQLKSMARRFLGRKDDTFWDDLTDDREFDTTNDRRMQLPQFQQGRISLDISQYGEGLPLELRVKLGLFRLRLHMKTEAIRHFEQLNRDGADLEGLEDMLIEVGDCLRADAMFEDAIKFYEPVTTFQTDENQRFWLSLAQCYSAVNRKDEAEQCYLKVSRGDENDLESRIQLARVYDSTGRHGKALQIAEEVIDIGRRPLILPQTPLRPLLPLKAKSVGDGNVTGSEVTPTANRVLPALLQDPPRGSQDQAALAFSPAASARLVPASATPQLIQTRRSEASLTSGTPREREARVGEHYAIVEKCWPAVDASSGNREAVQKWLKHAKAMATEFKAAHKLYQSDTFQQKPARPIRLPQALVQEMEKVKKRAIGELTDGPILVHQGNHQGNLYGIPAAGWHRVLAELALEYAKRVEQEKCYDILQNGLLQPLIFRQDAELLNATQAICIYCALLFNDSQLMTEVARDYITRSQRRSGMSFQFLAATGRFSHGEANFYDRKTTKWIHDTTNAHINVSDPPDAGLLTLCGHSALYSSHNNARPALPYLLQALKVQPENTVLNLSIATTYFTNAMRVTGSERNQDVVQGMAFFQRYYELRIADGTAVHVQEAEYNKARMWHQLGMAHHAAPGYEKVLEMSEEVKKDLAGSGGSAQEDFTMEAAFALQRILVRTGNDAAAKALGEKWLVL